MKQEQNKLVIFQEKKSVAYGTMKNGISLSLT